MIHFLIGAIESSLYFEIEDFKELLKLQKDLSKYLESRTSELELYVDNFALKARSPEEKDWIYEKHEQDHYSLTHSFPSIIYQSIFLKAYYTFEHILNKSCKSLYSQYSEKYNVNLKPADLKGSGIDNSVTYLKKVWDIDIKVFKDPLLRDIKMVRNSIVHNGSRLKENVQLNTPIAKGIINNKIYVEVDNNFSMEIIKFFIVFTGDLLDAFTAFSKKINGT